MVIGRPFVPKQSCHDVMFDVHMPVLHRYKDNDGYYLRANPPSINSPVTYQVHKTAESLFEAIGYGDGDSIPWNVIKPLRIVGHIYTQNGGVEPSDDDFDPDESLTSTSLDSDAEELLREHLESYSGGLDVESGDEFATQEADVEDAGTSTVETTNHVLYPPTREGGPEVDYDKTPIEVFGGEGSDYTDSFTLKSGPVFISLSTVTDPEVSITLVGKDSGTHETLFSNRYISNGFDGQFAEEVSGGDYLLNIKTEGEWQASVTQSVPPTVDLPLSISGRGPGIVGPFAENLFVGIEAEYYGDYFYRVDGIRDRRFKTDNILNVDGDDSRGVEASAAFGTGKHRYLEIYTRGEWELFIEQT